MLILTEKHISVMKAVITEKQRTPDPNEQRLMDEGLVHARRTEPAAWRCYPKSIHPPVSFETEAGQIRILREERPLLDDSLPLEGFEAKIKVHVVTLRQGSPSSEERFIGYAKVYEWSVGYLRGWDSKSSKILEKHGFIPEDTVADLALFYPLFEAVELKRKGIATAVLQHIISESRLEGLSGVYVPMATEWGGMRDFLDARGFEKANQEFYLKNFARDQ